MGAECMTLYRLKYQEAVSLIIGSRRVLSHLEILLNGLRSSAGYVKFLKN